VSQYLSTHAKKSISSLGSLQKASEWAHRNVIVSYGKCGSLDNVSVIVERAMCGNALMLL
jgi:hypothetical protein